MEREDAQEIIPQPQAPNSSSDPTDAPGKVWAKGKDALPEKEFLASLFEHPDRLREWLDGYRLRGTGEGAPPPAKQDAWPNLNRGGNTKDNRYGSGRRRKEIRALLQYGLLNEVLPVMALLIQEAKQGNVRHADLIKLFDMFAKYGLGPIPAAVADEEQEAAEQEDQNRIRVQLDFD